MSFQNLSYNCWYVKDNLGQWITVMWMLNDRPRDGGRGLHFVNKVVILLGKSMSVAHLLEVYFGEGGSCCFVIG